jgi:hypothetical protein
MEEPGVSKLVAVNLKAGKTVKRSDSGTQPAAPLPA